VGLLCSKDNDVRLQGAWALGNIAGDSPTTRDFVLSNGAMPPLLKLLQECTTVSMTRNAVWTLSNFCRGKPPPPFEIVSTSLPVLASLLWSPDAEVLTDACWALSYLSDGTDEQVQAVLDAGICSRMVELLSHSSYAVQTPALRTVGNIATGSDGQTQQLIDAGALSSLSTLINSPKKGIRKETCWTISNLTAGNKAHIQAVIDAHLVPGIIEALQNAEFDIKKEACWTVSNATSGGTVEQITYFVDEGCIEPLCDLLAVNDTRILGLVLEALENILKVGDKSNNLPKFTSFITENARETIKKLEEHGTPEVGDRATRLISLIEVKENTAV